MFNFWVCMFTTQLPNKNINQHSCPQLMLVYSVWTVYMLRKDSMFHRTVQIMVVSIVAMAVVRVYVRVYLCTWLYRL